MKNPKYFLLAMLGLMAAPALAQETYQDTKIAENALTGTARYVGMGGAMEALGADLSTMSTNPAGIGMFRRSQAALTASVIAQSSADKSIIYDQTRLTIDGKTSKPSFDQIGIVWSMANGRQSYVNLGFNFHKSTDFMQILNAANMLDGSSQSKLAAAKADYSNYLDDRYKNYYNNAGDWVWNGVDENYHNLIGKDENDYQKFYDGRSFLFGQYQHGYIGVYDFNVSGSIKNRVWWGITVGIHDVNYHSTSLYTENYVAEKEAFGQSGENLKIDGTGFDVKAGVIFRPVESSPFRIGAYVNTPVFYDLTMEGNTALALTDKNVLDSDGKYAYGEHRSYSKYDYRLNTPWKAGVSLGHTVGNYLALGLTYEYAWYDHTDNRVKDGGYYDGYDDTYYESSSSDKYMNEHTKATLNGVSTLKLGMEVKPSSMLALRLGYNYVSPMFKKVGVRDQSIVCYSDDAGNTAVNTATSTDYTNWKAINRFTCGVGFNYQKLFVDVAYQYSVQNGDFYPFMSNLALGATEGFQPAANSPAVIANEAPATKVSNKRHQLLMTIGYKF